MNETDKTVIMVGAIDPQYLDKDVQAYCDEHDLKLVRDRDDLLLLDIDTPLQRETYLEAGADLSFPIVDWFETASIHGNLHVYIKLPEPQPILTRLEWQHKMGSDPNRGFLDKQRVMQGVSVADSNVLFEIPEEFERVQKFLAD